MTLPKPIYNNTTDTYFFASQFRKYAIQFMAIFSDLKVSTGKNNHQKTTDLIHVPIRYGSADRVVSAIIADNTSNKTLRLPAMAAKVVGIELAPERLHGVDTTDRHTVLKTGESFPDGLEVVYRLNPVPYTMVFELSILTSNTKHHFEILEQILLLFNPILQIQTSDEFMDWTKINTIELININLEENYPAGIDKRSIVTTLQFKTTIHLSAASDIRKEVVKKIMIRLAAIPTFEDTQTVVNDIDRLIPEYQKLFDIEDFDIPEN